MIGGSALRNAVRCWLLELLTASSHWLPVKRYSSFLPSLKCIQVCFCRTIPELSLIPIPWCRSPQNLAPSPILSLITLSHTIARFSWLTILIWHWATQNHSSQPRTKIRLTPIDVMTFPCMNYFLLHSHMINTTSRSKAFHLATHTDRYPKLSRKTSITSLWTFPCW